MRSRYRKKLLEDFQNNDKDIPELILTSSKMLTTGVGC